MDSEPIPPAPTYRLDAAARTIAELERLLRDSGIRVAPGSGLERAFLAASHWVYEALTPSGVPDDARSDVRDTLGAVDLAANILSVKSHRSFDALARHLALVATADPSATKPVTGHSTVDCQLFELMVACWAMRAGADVVLEAPSEKQKEVNPDIVASVCALRVGVACKAPVSKSGATIYQRLREGAEQTLRRSDDDGRIVVINARSRVPFDSLQPMVGTVGNATDPPQFGAFFDPAEPPRVLAAAMKTLNRELAALRDEDLMLERDSPISRIDGWLIFGHAPTTIVTSARRIVNGTEATTVGPVQASAKYAGVAKLHPAHPGVLAFLNRLAYEANRAHVQAGEIVTLAGL